MIGLSRYGYWCVHQGEHIVVLRFLGDMIGAAGN